MTGTSSSLYVDTLFVWTVLLAIYLFYRAANNSRPAFLTVMIWFLVQGFIAQSKFYTVATMPPRFALLGLPPLIAILLLFVLPKGRAFIDGFNLKVLILIHLVRIPVELILDWLYHHGEAPRLMTFEGRNFDILAGITAPLIFYFAFRNGKVNKPLLLAWNIVCLLLLLNIVISAVLSIPSPFQQFGFEQPNVAVLTIPYMWLPACIVPIVLFSHFAAIRLLIRKNPNS